MAEAARDEDRPLPASSGRTRRNREEIDQARLGNEAQRLELDYLRSRLEHAKEIAAKRDKYAFWTFALLCGWSVATLLIALVSGLMEIPTGVTVALVTATAAQFASLLVIVLKFYFPAADTMVPVPDRRMRRGPKAR